MPLATGLGVAAIIAAVSLRIWQDHPPDQVLRQEAVLIGIGVVFAVASVTVKATRAAFPQADGARALPQRRTGGMDCRQPDGD